MLQSEVIGVVKLEVFGSFFNSLEVVKIKLLGFFRIRKKLEFGIGTAQRYSNIVSICTSSTIFSWIRLEA